MTSLPVRAGLILLAGAMLLGCANYQARENLRSGLLILDLTQSDVLEVWKAPTHTAAVSGDEIIKSGIAGWGGFFFKGREMYEMWDYSQRGARLVFYRQRLVAWKTEQTVQSLAAPPAEEIEETVSGILSIPDDQRN